MIAARLAVDAAAVAVLFAGVSKLVDLNQFARDLKTWTLVPQLAAAAAVFAIPLLEVLIAGIVLARQCSLRPAAWALVSLLAVFSAAYGVQVIWGEPPSCGCFGRFQQFMKGRNEALWVLSRNAVLLGLPVVALWFTRSNRAELRTPEPRPRPRNVLPSARAFTLVEIIATIAIIGLIVAIALPAIRAAKSRALQARSLSNLRQHAAVLATYNADYAQMYPYFTNPDAPTTVVARGTPWEMETTYFGAYQTWNLALAGGYYGGEPYNPVFTPPGLSPFEEYIFSGYWYSCAMIARPEHWNQDTRQGGTELLRPTLASEVRAPSSKILFVDWFAFGLTLGPEGEAGASVPVALCDGSASAHPVSEFGRQYRGGHSTPFDAAHGFHNTSTPPGMHTINGVRGSDVDRRR